jgi:hypothetical protein
MVKVKISNFSIDNSAPNSLPELEAKAFIVKTWKDDQTFDQKTIKNDYIILMSESEYRDKISARAGRKLNPLMVNFEEYN